MQLSFEHEVARFQKLSLNARASGGRGLPFGRGTLHPLVDTRDGSPIDELVEYRPQANSGTPRKRTQSETVQLAGKDFPLAIFGLVHGNEVAGLAVLNTVLGLLGEGILQPSISFVLGLGNSPAGAVGQRFVGRDLNRSFLRKETDTPEDRRADVLETVLARTRWFLDIHQTREPSDRPFFIFPYTPAGFAFARRIDARQTVVTHWGKPFSGDGRCSDEFVNASGGTGITVELGRNGFDPYQIAAGSVLVLRTIAAVQAMLGHHETAEAGAQAPGQLKPASGVGEIYTWAEVVAWPGKDAKLDPGWTNFRAVDAGQRLGFVGSGEILAPCSGRVLFPKYLDPVVPGVAPSPPPAEICRIMRRIDETQLGK